eukprot:TRINITY_DN15737_c0_g1_i1.p2 TRINITY_DN15737_c0_g1~~TRINITY_DN15737_c0_g1_i1.p2  ORF type:complete len:102 (+),score=15.26 TRINITY_DN15737_c0_g1_i1:1086-1391(+)
MSGDQGLRTLDSSGVKLGCIKSALSFLREMENFSMGILNKFVKIFTVSFLIIGAFLSSGLHKASNGSVASGLVDWNVDLFDALVCTQMLRCIDKSQRKYNK